MRQGRTASGARACARGVSRSARARSGVRITAERPAAFSASNAASAHVLRPEEGAPRATTSPTREARRTSACWGFSSGSRHHEAGRARNLTLISLMTQYWQTPLASVTHMMVVTAFSSKEHSWRFSSGFVTTPASSPSTLT